MDLIAIIWLSVLTVMVLTEGVYILWLRKILSESLAVTHDTLRLMDRVINRVSRHEELYRVINRVSRHEELYHNDDLE